MYFENFIGNHIDLVLAMVNDFGSSYWLTEANSGEKSYAEIFRLRNQLVEFKSDDWKHQKYTRFMFWMCYRYLVNERVLQNIIYDA